MRVFLINPPPHKRLDQYDTLDFTRFGLAYLAGQLLTDPACKVEIVEANLITMAILSVISKFTILNSIIS